MSLHFETESGSHYEIRDAGVCYDSHRQIRRINTEPGAKKRADGRWVTLHTSHPASPIVGQRISLVLESLASLGPDDHGTTEPDQNYTTRLTTPVSRVWEE